MSETMATNNQPWFSYFPFPAICIRSLLTAFTSPFHTDTLDLIQFAKWVVSLFIIHLFFFINIFSGIKAISKTINISWLLHLILQACLIVNLHLSSLWVSCCWDSLYCHSNVQLFNTLAWILICGFLSHTDVHNSVIFLLRVIVTVRLHSWLPLQPCFFFSFTIQLQAFFSPLCLNMDTPIFHVLSPVFANPLTRLMPLFSQVHLHFFHSEVLFFQQHRIKQAFRYTIDFLTCGNIFLCY